METRIYVDFNTTMMDSKERVYLGSEVLDQGMNHLSPSLKPGDLIILYDEEMQVEAIIEFDSDRQVWLAQPIWATLQDLSP